jgi:hypothetical protein
MKISKTAEICEIVNCIHNVAKHGKYQNEWLQDELLASIINKYCSQHLSTTNECNLTYNKINACTNDDTLLFIRNVKTPNNLGIFKQACRPKGSTRVIHACFLLPMSTRLLLMLLTAMIK